MKMITTMEFIKFIRSINRYRLIIYFGNDEVPSGQKTPGGHICGTSVFAGQKYPCGQIIGEI